MLSIVELDVHLFGGLKMKLARLLATASMGLMLAAGSQAFAQSEPFLGQLMPMANTYCPRFWTEANGQLLAISTNSALFSLFGTTYGGDGRTTFALPDLRGRVAMHTGQGPGQPSWEMGQTTGQPTVTLTASNLPRHTHPFYASAQTADSPNPAGNALATFASGTNVYVSGGPAPNQALSAATVGSAGQNLPVSEYQPTLVIRYCVALNGVFPSRN